MHQRDGRRSFAGKAKEIPEECVADSSESFGLHRVRNLYLKLAYAQRTAQYQQTHEIPEIWLRALISACRPFQSLVGFADARPPESLRPSMNLPKGKF